VLETMLEKIFASRGAAWPRWTGRAASTCSGATPTRRADGRGEAIVFTYGQNVELEGRNGSRRQPRPGGKGKGPVRLRDFTERGDDENWPTGTTARLPRLSTATRVSGCWRTSPAIWPHSSTRRDRIESACALWPRPWPGRAIRQERGRAGLHGDDDPAEQAALKKLVANWRALIDARISDIVAKQGSAN